MPSVFVLGLHWTGADQSCGSSTLERPSGGQVEDFSCLGTLSVLFHVSQRSCTAVETLT